MGRNTSGVKVMNVDDNVQVASIAKVRNEEVAEEPEEKKRIEMNENWSTDLLFVLQFRYIIKREFTSEEKV